VLTQPRTEVNSKELCAEVGDGVRVEAAYRGGVRASTSPPKE
jgi:hypothetical protein